MSHDALQDGWLDTTYDATTDDIERGQFEGD